MTESEPKSQPNPYYTDEELLNMSPDNDSDFIEV